MRLKLAYAGPAPVPVAASQVDAVVCFDFTSDCRRDMAVTIASGGAAATSASSSFGGRDRSPRA